MRTLIDIAFATGGVRRPRAEPGPGCPSDDSLASYFDRSASATDRRRLEDHALVCSDCHALVQAVGQVLGTRAPARGLSVVARVLRRGLELLNPVEVRLRSLLDGPVAELGVVRGAPVAEAAPTGVGEVIAVDGPGHGLDELRIQLQPDGHVQLQVRAEGPLPVLPGEISSVVLEVDGAPREKRPFDGSPLAFAPLEHGCFRVRLVARAPGSEARELSEATVELRD